MSNFNSSRELAEGINVLAMGQESGENELDILMEAVRELSEKLPSDSVEEVFSHLKDKYPAPTL